MTSSPLPSHVACPACQQVTPLPVQVAPTAVVRCPHCQAQYVLQELLGDPAIVWQLVSDSNLTARDPYLEDGKAEIGSLDSEQLHGDEYDDKYIDEYTDEHSDAVGMTTMPRSVAPGAETVEISGFEDLVESWNDDSPEGELEDNPAESAGEASSPRKLEGPLVGEFPDDPEDDEYPPWRPLAAQSSVDPTHREVSEITEDLDQQPSFTPSSIPPSASRSVSSRSASRRKLPRRSPVWSMLQVTLGGLAAIPVSLLLMWHLLGTDIGDAAPWVAQYVPWIVPQKFHPYPPSSSSAAAHLQPGTAADSSQPLPRLPTPGSATDETALAKELPEDEIPTVQPRSLSDVDLPADLLEAPADSEAVDSQSRDPLSAEVASLQPAGAQDVLASNAPTTANSSDTSGDFKDAFPLDSQSVSDMLDSLEPPETKSPESKLPETAPPESKSPETKPQGAELEIADSLDKSAARSLDSSTDGETSAATDLVDKAPLSSKAPPSSNSRPSSTDELDSAALEDCFTLIRETDAMLQDWSLAVSAKQHSLALAQDTYSELASVALAVGKLPTRESVQQAMRLQMKPVQRQVEQKLEVRNLIDQGARFWIRKQSQSTTEPDSGSTEDEAAEPSGDNRYGLAVTAVVESITLSPDGLSCMVVALASTQSGDTAKLPLELQIPQALISLLPEGELSVGQKLFLLGTVERPAEDAANVVGSADNQPPFVANYLSPL